MNAVKLFLIVWCVLVAGFVAAADEREWRVRGEFKSLAPGKHEVAVFALRDGSRIEVPLASLTDEDRAAIRQKTESANAPQGEQAIEPVAEPKPDDQDVATAAAQRVTHAIELLNLGNGPLAKQELQQASRLDKSNGTADFVMGLAYACGARDFPKAIGHFREAVGREPKNGFAWANLAVCAVLDKRYGDVASQFRKAFEQMPDSQSLANNVALIIREAGSGRVKMPAKQLTDLNEVYRRALADGKLAPLDPQGAKTLVLYGLHGGSVEVTAQNGLAISLAAPKPVDAGPNPNELEPGEVEPEPGEVLQNLCQDVVELTPELARKLVRAGCREDLEFDLGSSLAFPKVSSISDDVAEILGQTSANYLALDGLTEISKVAAGHLVRHGKPFYPWQRRLNLKSVKRLTPECAAALGRYPGALVLNGIEELPPDIAKALAPQDVHKFFTMNGQEIGKGFLFLNGVKSLSAAAATALANIEGELQIGLTALEADVAAALGGNKVSNSLILRGITELSAGSAAGLSQHKGELWLPQLDQLSPDASKPFSTRRGYTSIGVTSLTPDVAANLAKIKGMLYLPRVTSLEPEVARALASHEGDLVLDLENISVDAARMLATKEGGISLGLVAASDAVIEALSRHRGMLVLDKMTVLTLNAARSLANHEGILSFGCQWTEADEAAITTLAQHRGVLFIPKRWHEYPAIREHAERFPAR
jgi:tetratricopeptide (TPR) repeat protein